MSQTFDVADVEAGQAVYSKKLLLIYDLYVLGLSNRFIWRNPTQPQVKHYSQHVSSRHLDIGVGTGYFPDKCRFPVANPEIVLMDLNNNSLSAAAHRIRRYQPECYIRNVLEPIELPEEPFGSIGINYLLHCLPGSILEKAVVFDHLLPHLQEGGVVFGSTLLQQGIKRSWLAQKLMAFYNSKGIFHNQQDSLEGLELALAACFSRYQIKIKGCGVLFAAWK